MQPGWTLPLVLDAHTEWPLKAFRCRGDIFGNLALENSLLGRVAHLEFPARDFRGGDDFKVGDRNEVPDLQLALADDCSRRRLHTTNTADAPGPRAAESRSRYV